MTRRILLAASFLLPLSVYPHGERERPAGAAPPTLAELRALPKIDVHSHYEHDDPALVPTLEEWNLRSVLVNVFSDHRLIEKGENMHALQAAHPERFFLITTFDPFPIDDPDFAAKTIARLRGEIARGAKGVKVWKNIGMEVKDGRGEYVQIDDPRFQPIWDFLAEQKIPVLAHIGEPRAAWLPLDARSPHYWYYSHHPEYHAYAHPEIPRWETIIAARDRWVARNPKLVIIGAHLASLETSVDELAKRLDAYPNLYIDTAARFNDLAMQPSARVRDFMIRYQDRVLYGTDFGEGDFSGERLDDGYRQQWSYLAGADSVDFGQPGAWHARVPGLALPRPVLEKIAHLNAERVLNLPAAGDAAARGGGWRANPEVVRRTTASQPGFNFEESRAGSYTLPDPLRMANGTLVTSKEQWRARRAEILELLRENVYGRSPGKPQTLRFEVREEDPHAMNGAATLKRISVVSRQSGREHRFELVLFLPNARPGKVPVFLLLNNRAASNTDPTRKVRSGFWPAEEMIARGYGIAALQVGELAPDSRAHFREGVIGLFEGSTTAPRPADAWGALGAWAWGASRAMDYFETDPRVDARKVAVLGHSRGGKAALWTGAQDERFALVISNESGEGGAALSRRDFGETITRINTSFPHWFDGNYKRFNGHPEALPTDQHLLLALIAPRALYVASADEDLWSDPRGEFLSLAASSPVFALGGDAAIGADAMPPLDTPLVVGRRAYHVRTGVHNLTPWDWARYADFADRLWGR